jgi:hypothetical protein
MAKTRHSLGAHLGGKRPENGLVVWVGELFSFFFFKSFFTTYPFYRIFAGARARVRENKCLQRYYYYITYKVNCVWVGVYQVPSRAAAGALRTHRRAVCAVAATAARRAAAARA